MSPLSILMSGGFSGVDRYDLNRYVTSLDAEGRAEAEAASGVKHARLIGPVACFAALAGVELRLRMRPGSSGLICTGGPWALPACARYVDRLSAAGPSFVNPLQFPSTLVSSTASAVAAMLDAHDFAVTVGHDRFAFFDALESARSYLNGGFSKQVIIAAAASADPMIEAGRVHAQLALPTLDVATAFCVSSCGVGDLKLLELSSHSSPSDVVPNAYTAEWQAGAFASSIDTPLARGEAFGAAGAVFLISAATIHRATARDPQEPFSICMTAEGRIASATFST